MEVLVVNQSQVYELLPMAECIRVMEDALVDLARGECQLPLRQIMWLPEKTGALGLMPCYWKSANVLGVAVEDLASAYHVYNKALASGMGKKVAFGGRRRAAD